IMNQEQIRQVTARDEKWVPTKYRFKISCTNVRLETTGVDFAEVPDDESTLTFLIDLGYKGPLYKYPSIIGEDFQEYGLPIPETMLTEGIKQSKSYQMFIKYSTGQIPPKKSRGKGSQEKKTADIPEADADVSEESDSEHA
ncbi:hypothetical protein Tco_1572192, partial [Tanacetum coccineum]